MASIQGVMEDLWQTALLLNYLVKISSRNLKINNNLGLVERRKTGKELLTPVGGRGMSPKDRSHIPGP